MTQTILSVVAAVQPASAEIVRTRLDAFTVEQEVKPLPGDQAYDRLRSAVPVLHFMSMTVAFDDQYDPIFVLEANFDGEPGPFWGQLEAAMGPLLREVFRLCKPPRDQRLALFNAVTAVDSRVPLAPLLEAFTIMPAVSHQGNRGIKRTRIIADGKLFQALRDAVDSNPALRSSTASDMHRILRAELLPTFPWLSEPVGPRIGFAENIADYLRLFSFAAALVLAFYGVGWLFKLIAQALCPALASTQLRLPEAWADMAWVRCIVSFILLTLLGVLAVLPAALWRMRQLEQRDATNDAPRLDEAALSAMARNEDYVAQNHMISIVHIKPGILRMILAQLILLGLGLVIRCFNRSGYLASMRTIHFAHWAVLDNGGRLMFHSNFDGSWESYLDDFIEKAHAGLTLAWTHGVGFPPTRLLFMGGATEGRKFKAWARHSMSPSQFWFSAYKEYSVNQIERQARLADGLRRAQLNEQEAQAWLIDL